MTARRTLYFAMIVALSVSGGALSAQSPCRALLQVDSLAYLATRVATPTQAFVESVLTIRGRALHQRFLNGSRDPDTATIAALQPLSRSNRTELAEALARSLRGESVNYDADRAYLSALTYHALALGLEPLGNVLASRESTGRDRWLALVALQHLEDTEGYFLALQGAVCALAGKAGADWLLPNSTTVPEARDLLLSEDEWDALVSAMGANGRRAEARLTTFRVRELLPVGTPMSKYLERHFPSAW